MPKHNSEFGMPNELPRGNNSIEDSQKIAQLSIDLDGEFQKELEELNKLSILKQALQITNLPPNSKTFRDAQKEIADIQVQMNKRYNVLENKKPKFAEPQKPFIPQYTRPTDYPKPTVSKSEQIKKNNTDYEEIAGWLYGAVATAMILWAGTSIYSWNQQSQIQKNNNDIATAERQEEVVPTKVESPKPTTPEVNSDIEKTKEIQLLNDKIAKLHFKYYYNLVYRNSYPINEIDNDSLLQSILENKRNLYIQRLSLINSLNNKDSINFKLVPEFFEEFMNENPIEFKKVQSSAERKANQEQNMTCLKKNNYPNSCIIIKSK